MKKSLILLLTSNFLFYSGNSFAQSFAKLKFDKSAISKNYTYQGEVIKGERWNDKNGDNSLIISQKRSKLNDDYQDEIFVYHYATRNGKSNLLWKYSDSAYIACDKGDGLLGTSVKDADNNGIAENTFIYSIAGRCDVSTVPYYLIMHQGKNSYSIKNVAYNYFNAPKGSPVNNKFIIKSDIDKNLRKLAKPIYVSTFSLWNNYVIKNIFQKNSSLYAVKEGYLPGKHPEASRMVLNKFQIKNKATAQLMVNEIYARHNYNFKDKIVSEYFNQQIWPIPMYDNVTDFFTKAEEININLLTNFK